MARAQNHRQGRGHPSRPPQPLPGHTNDKVWLETAAGSGRAHAGARRPVPRLSLSGSSGLGLPGAEGPISRCSRGDSEAMVAGMSLAKMASRPTWTSWGSRAGAAVGRLEGAQAPLPGREPPPSLVQGARGNAEKTKGAHLPPRSTSSLLAPVPGHEEKATVGVPSGW